MGGNWGKRTWKWWGETRGGSGIGTVGGRGSPDSIHSSLLLPYKAMSHRANRPPKQPRLGYIESADQYSCSKQPTCTAVTSLGSRTAPPRLRDLKPQTIPQPMSTICPSSTYNFHTACCSY